MNAPLWTAHLNSQSPRYKEWREIFLTDEVKLQSPIPLNARLGEEQTKIYAINVGDLDEATLGRLMTNIAGKFGVSEEMVAAQIEKDACFPIRESDVIVAFSMRAFI